jgi:RHS repeat-associated protein
VATYTYNVRNEIERVERPGEVQAERVVLYLYDDNGNRTDKGYDTNGDDEINTWLATYEYDTSNRLDWVDTDNDGDPDFEAVYDYRTRRVSKTTYPGGTAETTVFRYDGGVSFDEWKDGVKQVEFVRGSGLGGGIGSILYSDRFAGPNPGREYFVYSPAVGHTVATLRDDATVKSTNLYEAFGNVVKLNVNTWEQTDGPTSGTSDNNRLANTKERDASIGLDNHGFRYYDPEIGRYTTRDPIGYAAGTLNVYVYVRSNPINWSDPLGLETTFVVSKEASGDKEVTYKKGGKTEDMSYKDYVNKVYNPRLDGIAKSIGESGQKTVQVNGKTMDAADAIAMVQGMRGRVVVSPEGKFSAAVEEAIAASKSGDQVVGVAHVAGGTDIMGEGTTIMGLADKLNPIPSVPFSMDVSLPGMVTKNNLKSFVLSGCAVPSSSAEEIASNIGKPVYYHDAYRQALAPDLAYNPAKGELNIKGFGDQGFTRAAPGIPRTRMQPAPQGKVDELGVPTVSGYGFRRPAP